jgi:hypothetical protein
MYRIKSHYIWVDFVNLYNIAFMWPFKPKWKSRDPQKRLKGLKELNPEKPTHKEILDNIAKMMKFMKSENWHFYLLAKETAWKGF